MLISTGAQSPPVAVRRSRPVAPYNYRQIGTTTPLHRAVAKGGLFISSGNNPYSQNY
jgi:hypothetical protein